MKKKISCLLLSIFMILQILLPLSSSLVRANNDESMLSEIEKNLVNTEPENFIFNKDKKMIEGIKKSFLSENKYIKLVIPAKIDNEEVENIDSLAFYNIEKIKKIDFTKAKKLKKIGAYAFSFIKLYKQNEIDFSKTIIEGIDKYAFFDDEISKIKLNESTINKLDSSSFGNRKDVLNSEIDGYIKKLAENRYDISKSNNNVKQLVYDNPTNTIDINDKEIFKIFEKELKDFQREKLERLKKEESEKQANFGENNSPILNRNRRSLSSRAASDKWTVTSPKNGIQGNGLNIKPGSITVSNNGNGTLTLNITVRHLTGYNANSSFHSFEFQGVNVNNGNDSGNPMRSATSMANKLTSISPKSQNNSSPGENKGFYTYSFIIQEPSADTTFNVNIYTSNKNGIQTTTNATRGSVSTRVSIKKEQSIVPKGSININLSNNNSANLNGIIFDLKKDGSVIMSQSYPNTSFINLDIGTYYLDIKNIPSGYKVDKQTESVNVTQNNVSTVTFTITKEETVTPNPEPDDYPKYGPTPATNKNINVPVVIPDYEGQIQYRVGNQSYSTKPSPKGDWNRSILISTSQDFGQLLVTMPQIQGYNLPGGYIRILYAGQVNPSIVYEKTDSGTENGYLSIAINGGYEIENQIIININGNGENLSIPYSELKLSGKALKQGNYSVTVSTPSGYRVTNSPQSINITPSSNNALSFDIVKEDVKLNRVTIGFYNSETNQPISEMNGKKVQVIKIDSNSKYTGNAAGNRVDYQLPTGNYRVGDFTPPVGFEIQKDTIFQSPSSSEVRVLLNPVSKLQSLDVSILPPSRQSLPNVNVSLYDTNGNLVRGPIIANNSSKRALFNNLPNGEYNVIISGLPSNWRLKNEVNPIILTGNDTVKTFEYQIVMPSSNKVFISGQIINSNRIGVEGVKVRIKNARGEDITNAGEIVELTSGKNGNIGPVEINRPPAGLYTVYTTEVPNGYSNGERSLGRTTASTTSINFTMPLSSTMFDIFGEVKNSSGEPVSGVEFKIKDNEGNFIKDQSGADLILTSDSLGLIEKNTIRPNPGSYTLVNTSVPGGYKLAQDQNMKIESTSKNVRFSTILQRAGLINWEIRVEDEAGNPIPNKSISFFDNINNKPLTSSGRPLQVVSDQNGMIYIDQMRVGEFRAEFAGDSDYSKSNAVQKINGNEENSVVRTKLVLPINGDKGRITVSAIEEGTDKKVGYVDYIIKNEKGVQVISSSTDLVTGQNSHLLPYGKYTVEYADTNKSTTLVNEKSQSATISSAKKTDNVDFIVKRNKFEILNAGSIKIDASAFEDDKGNTTTSWTVTVDKFASEPRNSKRGTINTLKVPVSQLVMPSTPKLIIQVGNSEQVETPVEGVWQKEGDYYIFRDDRSKDYDLTDKAVKYIYSFTAEGIDGATKYTLDATTKIVSSDVSEIIPEQTASKTLDANEEKQGIFVAYGEGEGRNDDDFDIVHWNYRGTVEEIKTPGYTTFIIRQPDDSGLIPLSDVYKPTIQIYEKGSNFTKLMENPPSYKIEFDAAKKEYRIKFDTRKMQPFEFKMNIDSTKNNAESVTNHKLDTSYKFDPIIDSINIPDKEIGQRTIIALSAPKPIGKSEEFISPCEIGRHKVNISARISDDGKKIYWTVRGTNLSSDQIKKEMSMSVLVGEGLGPAKLLSINSLGKSFPFVTVGGHPMSGQYVYDAAGQNNNATKEFTVSVTDNYSFITGLRTDYSNKYNYITGFDRKGSITWFKANIKTDPNGNEFVRDIGTLIDTGAVSTSEDQSLRVSEYVQYEFETDITDFSKIREGYTINVLSQTYNNTEAYQKPSLCQMESSLTVKDEPNKGEVKTVVLRRDKYAEVQASGQYINDGQDIEWTIKVVPLRDRGGLWDTGQDFERQLKVAFELVDETKESTDPNRVRDDTGLADIDNVDEQMIQSNGFHAATAHLNKKGTIDITRMNMGEEFRYKFTTHVDEDKEKYTLEVKGYYGERALPLIDDGGKVGDHIGYVELEGKATKVHVQKSWKNIYDNQSKPTITLRLKQIAVDGTIKELAVANVDTDKSANFTEYTFVTYSDNGVDRKIPRFDANGYRYQYVVTEDNLDGYESDVFSASYDGTGWFVSNTKDESISYSNNPITYKNYSPDAENGSGRYSTTSIKTDPDVLNVETTSLNEKNEPYKIKYEDSIVGKSGYQTDVPGMFDMKLTIEGYGRGRSGDLDVMFVLDNSPSMNKTWIAENGVRKEKMGWLSDTVKQSIDEIFRLYPTARIGIVNFGTAIEPSKAAAGKMKYPERPFMELTGKNYRDNLAKATPEYNSSRSDTVPHSKREIGYYLYGVNNNGQTNIAIGMAKATDLLYPENEKGTNMEKRQKLMVVLSDGAPVASLKLKNYPLDTSKSLEENLVPVNSGARAESFYLGKYVYNNNTYRLKGDTAYYTDNGVRIDNHGIATLAVSRYLQETHKDMEVVSVAIAPDINGFDPISGEKEDEGETSLRIMKGVLTGISTKGEDGYYQADKPDHLTSYIDSLKTHFRNNSIVNGTVIDPMGDKNIILHDPDDKFTVASGPELNDGDFYISDNHGNYLAKDGGIRNNRGNGISIHAYQAGRNTFNSLVYQNYKNYSEYKLDTFGQPLKIYDQQSGKWVDNAYENGRYQYLLVEDHSKSYPPSGVYLRGENRNFSVITSIDHAIEAKNRGARFIVLRNNERGGMSDPFIDKNIGYNSGPKIEATQDKNLLQGVKVQRIIGDNGKPAIKITGLNLGTDEEVTLRYRIHIDTESKDFIPNNYYLANSEETILYPKPDIGDYVRYFPVPSVKAPNTKIILDKEWVTKSGEIIDYNKTPDLNITLQVLRYEALKNEKGVPILDKDGNAQKDPNKKTILREVVLNKENKWHYENNDLPAYDSNGVMYFYEGIEKEVPEGYKAESSVTVPKFTYNIKDGYVSDDKSAFKITAKNIQDENPYGRFKILKLDKDNTYGKVVLKDAVFRLSKLDDNSSPIKDSEQIINTDEYGYITYNNIEKGNYLLEEIKAPSGYKLLPTKILVSIDEPIVDGRYTVKLYRLDKSGNINGERQEIKPDEQLKTDIGLYPVYYITNEKMNIPNTGYYIQIPTLIILGMVLTGVILIYINKQNTKKLVEKLKNKRD